LLDIGEIDDLDALDRLRDGSAGGNQCQNEDGCQCFAVHEGLLLSERLPIGFYLRPTLEVAGDLLGRVLCSRTPEGRVLRGRIVEVEAYDGPKDRASHASRGMTRRNAPMFEAGGIAYVYQIYGIHHCFNVVTGSEGYPAAVLLRAAESPDGALSASGPGRLCRAFRVDRTLDGASLLGRRVWLEQGVPPSPGAIGRTARIGVDYAGWWARREYRFIINGHPQLSRR
jgi:DNA-3-methyladenine glycosylase